MRFPLSEQLVDEATRHGLRAGCAHCFHRLADGSCGNGWPLEGQERWPIDAPDPTGKPPLELVFCREFELG